MIRRCSFIALALLLTGAGAAAAQSSAEPSLAEIARKAEVAKPTVPKAKKTYTNADLSGGGLPPAPASTASGTSGNQSPAAPGAKPAPEQAAAPAAEVEVEEVWRKRADRIRSQVKSMQTRLTELMSRPPNPNPTLQQRTEKEMTGIRADFVKLRLQWAQLEMDANRAKVSVLWIEPMPAFPQ